MTAHTSNHRARTLFFQPGERNIFFHLLTGCNLSCRHCYINPDQHGRGPVSRHELMQWLELFATPNQESNLIFLGGEPTLHPDLVSGVRRARELGYRGITIDTNGYLHHNLLARLAPDEAVLSFSLDGPTPEINDPIRGAGVFATCTANLQQAVAAGFDVSLIFTASRMNIDHLAQMPALLEKLGCRRFFIQVIGIRGKSARPTDSPTRPQTEPVLQLSPEQWREIVPQVAADAAARGIRVIYPKVYLEAGEPFQCAGLQQQSYFIFPNGRVYLCPLCEDFPLHAWQIENGRLVPNPGLTERQLFTLEIAEGCVMNKLLQPGNIDYDPQGRPRHRISCCLLKQEVQP
ncbi:radical SAM protein [Desulfurivibrio alkaliphilus]|uniref:Radical SAM domain protein n=1 Tax=Desulfurivibrio alkaliphilus (strain DSM 19089 / UNIQEM U267 / AHT2) TaxID=589865 RepID=D6Z4B0_DESAT|nr:radical SAM protein [Desulfurivibrio alkaliphilus]ADH86385.1 Radical SAM domain protein [Desulfurivibrio alkaliphilus AHT 2]